VVGRGNLGTAMEGGGLWVSRYHEQFFPPAFLFTPRGENLPYSRGLSFPSPDGLQKFVSGVVGQSVRQCVPNRPGRHAGPWGAILPGVLRRVGKDGRARCPSCVKTAVLWVDGRHLLEYSPHQFSVRPIYH